MIKYIYCALVSCYTYLQHCMNAHRLTPVSLLIQVCVIFSDMKSFKEVIPCTVGNHCLTLRTSVGETSSGSTPAKSSTPATSTVKFPAAIKSGSAVTSPGGFSCTAPTESESDVTMTLVAFDWVSPIDNMLEIPSIVSKISYNCIIISKIESKKAIENVIFSNLVCPWQASICKCVLYCICWIYVPYWNVDIYFVINHYHFCNTATWAACVYYDVFQVLRNKCHIPNKSMPFRVFDGANVSTMPVICLKR